MTQNWIKGLTDKPLQHILDLIFNCDWDRAMEHLPEDF